MVKYKFTKKREGEGYNTDTSWKM